MREVLVQPIDIFPWNDNFSTGLPEIDQQHLKLVQLLNLLASHLAFRSDIPQLNVILDELTDYTIYHFQTEEAIWHEYLSSDAIEVQHKETHERFVKTILRLKDDQAFQTLDSIVRDALAFLTRWLASHILETDRHFAYVVLALKSGLSLDAAKQRAAEQMSGGTRVLIEIILSIYETLSINTLNLMREVAEHKSDEAIYREIFKASSDAINITHAENGRYFEVNQSFLEITGHERDEVIGHTGMELNLWVNPKDRQKLIEVLHREGAVRNQEIQFSKKNGEIIWGMISSTKLQLKGEDYLLSVTRDITKRKHAEQALQIESEKNLALLHNASDGIHILDTDGKVIEASDSFCAMLGYEREEMIGMHVSQWDNSLSHAEIHHLLKSQFEQKVRSQFELRHRRKDGTVFDVEVSGFPLELDGKPVIFLSSRNISERKLAERALQESEERYRLLFDSNIDGALLTTPEGIVLAANPSACEMFQRTEEEIRQVGRNSLVDKSDSRLANAIDERNKTGKFVGELTLIRKDGTRFTGEVSSALFKDKDGKYQTSMTIRDITERKRLEEQVRHLAFYDFLTKLPNRRLLDDRLSQTLAISKRTELFGALMFLDLDNFKPLNDMHGHATGDLLLIEAANRLKSCMREMDTVSRFGGDEFVVLLSELDVDKNTAKSQAGIVAEKIRNFLSEPYLLPLNNGREKITTIEHQCTVSIGVTLFINNETSQDDIFKRADAAMYLAKDAGRNQICFL